MVLTVSFVISPVIGLVVTVALRSPAKLDASVEASGPHDFAVRVQHRSSAAPNSVHRIPPRVRDDRERPSVGRDGAIRKVFCVWGETKYFREQGWTGQIGLIAFEKIAGTRISETASFMACCLLGFRKRQPRPVKPDRPDFVHGGRIGLTQLARGSDCRFAIGAIDDVEPQQLLLALGERAVGNDPLPSPRSTQASFVAPSRAAGPR